MHLYDDLSDNKIISFKAKFVKYINFRIKIVELYPNLNHWLSGETRQSDYRRLLSNASAFFFSFLLKSLIAVDSWQIQRGNG